MNQLQRFFIAAGMMCIPFLGKGCDICGCSSGNNSVGLIQLIPRHFLGFRWQSQGFHTDAHGSEPDAREHFQTVEFWGRWQPHRRVQAILAVPYQINYRKFSNGNSLLVNGLGDIYLAAYWSVLNPLQQSTHRWKHTIQVGGGMKLPTGRADFKDIFNESKALPPALQPGSGSTDFNFSILYALRLGQWGVSVDGAFRYNGENDNGHRFGNRHNATTRIFFSKNVGSLTLLPYLGAALDVRKKDTERGKNISETGGWIGNGLLGAEVFRGDLGLSISWQLPFASHLSNGRVEPTSRLNASVVLFFGRKIKNQKMEVPNVFQSVKLSN